MRIMKLYLLFVCFRTANKNLKDSNTYKQCQKSFLLTIKKSHPQVLQTGFSFLRKESQSVLNSIDFAHICSLFPTGNDSSIKSHQNIRKNKFNKLLKERQPRQDPEKVIFNYSNISLSDAGKSFLVKGLKFSIPPKKLNYADYLVNFELFYRSICKLDKISNDILDFVKTKIKNAALTSFRYYNVNLPRNLSDEEFKTLQNLSKNINLVVQKSDKGNSVVIVDKDVYIQHMELLLSDRAKFEKVDTKKGLLNFTVNHEKRIKEDLKYLKLSGALSVVQYKKIKPVGSRPGILHSLFKIHKNKVDRCPPFRPIVSAIGMPPYKIAKFLVPRMNFITSNEFNVKDTFFFAKEIVEQDSSLVMGS